ncbi:MAG: hypothetical protein JRN45_00550 [Nitrososphaerota archaeon]|nr:hypothetical protein [Nitrososphaerota archaeon]
MTARELPGDGGFSCFLNGREVVVEEAGMSSSQMPRGCGLTASLRKTSASQNRTRKEAEEFMTYCPESGNVMRELKARPNGKDCPRYRCDVCGVTWEWNDGTYTLAAGEIP